jgi:hypothetical protein
MLFVHGGVDAGCALLESAIEPVEVGGLAGAVEPEGRGEVLVVVAVDVLCVPDPDVALVHPTSTTPVTHTNIVTCAQRRIIGFSSDARRPRYVSCRRFGTVQ